MDQQILILVVSFLLLLVMNVPIAVAIGVSTLLTILSIGDAPAFYIIAQRMSSGVGSFPLLAIPFFILSGILMGRGGLARRLIDFASGLTYALDGGMQRVADKVFLLTPRNVEVSAEERARLLERGGFFNQA